MAAHACAFVSTPIVSPSAAFRCAGGTRVLALGSAPTQPHTHTHTHTHRYRYQIRFHVGCEQWRDWWPETWHDHLAENQCRWSKTVDGVKCNARKKEDHLNGKWNCFPNSHWWDTPGPPGTKVQGKEVYKHTNKPYCRAAFEPYENTACWEAQTTGTVKVQVQLPDGKCGHTARRAGAVPRV